MKPTTSAATLVALSAFLMLGSVQALAADEPVTGIPESSIAKNFPDKLDADGRRAALAQRGISYGINYYGEVFGNVAGGIRRGSGYSGELEAIVDFDFEKMGGWKGLTGHVSGFQLHGHGISTSNVGLLNPVSNIEATPATRLFEVWFEQELVKDKLAVRVGQMLVDYDSEFINSQVAGIFINTNLGWPAFTAVNLPSGGVSFPLAGMGARVKYTPNAQWTFLAAVFNDDPAGPCPQGDPQKCNNDGLKFRMQDDPFVIGEIQYKYGDNKKPGILGGLLKIGAFNDYGAFNHNRFGTDGLSLADPASNGNPRRLHGNLAVYGVIEQQLYRSNKSGASPNDGVYAFGRIAGMPSDRNLVDFTFDAGLRFAGMVPGRPKDEFGIAFAHNRIAHSVSGLDRDANLFSGVVGPIHSAEWVGELTYKWQLAEGWNVQPDLQYIWRPGGNAADPNVATKPIENALVLGVRSTVNY